MLPAGTVYAKVTDAHAGEFGAVCIKGETVGADWYEQRLIGEFTELDSEEGRVEALGAMRRGESRTPDFETPRRDSLFKADQLFAVFEQADVVALTFRLTRATFDAYRDLGTSED
ncbi:hypothetical protein D2V04_15105 [Pelagerythrobacter aerophilus]|uniref:Uncharacterized protein n=1 Tax=Pelagerythrobacter aerophilus TaxID=2306995 RepID=A0A418NDP2_9SPHN|nr:hypothetical protein D2V04_15105 [Pelagerythrobacter aerophilus]